MTLELISLLNKYELEREKGVEEFKNWTLPLWERYLCQWELAYEPAENFFNWETLIWDSANSVVISKHYGFIKRLVDNDKIDKKKIDTRLVRYVESHYDEEWYWVENSYEDYELYECLLMLISIQDNPIEFLISILK